jgi:magnesium chelatase subunit I
MAAGEYERQVARAAGFGAAMTKLGAAGHPARVAAAVEFVLEGLHLNRKLNKDRGAGGPRYRAAA